MKSLQTSVLMSLLVSLFMGCTSSTALQSSETDDMYFASTDKVVRQEMGTPPAESVNSDEAVNPEYSGATSGSSGGSSVTNNYNYYDSDYSYASRSRTVRSPYRNWSYYDYGYYHDPYWYAPGAFFTPYYSAAYCYPGMYDPFWGPAYYPYSGITVSIGYGFGYGGFYGGHRPWGYRPYGGYYGYGYGNGYYQGFYEGYYAGSGNRYYGVNHRKVNYAPRGDRSNVPQSAPASATGRPVLNGNRQDGTNGITPGRPMAPNGNNVSTNGRPQRATTNSVLPEQANTPKPEIARPTRGNVSESNQASPGRAPETARPAQRPIQEVRPQNYEFQPQPAQQSTATPNTPRSTVNQQNMPAMQPQQSRPAREQVVQPQSQPVREQVVQQEQPVYQPQPGLSRPNRQPAMQQQTQPAVEQTPRQPANRGIFGRPSRSEQPQAPVMRESQGSTQPSYQNTPSRTNSSSPSNSGGRPRR